MRVSKRKILYHTGAWLFYVLVVLLGADEVDTDFIAKSIASIVPGLILFYINILLLFPVYLRKPNYPALIFWLLIFCAMTVGIRVGLFMLFYKNQFIFDAILFWNQFRMNLLFIGISFAYWFAERNYENNTKRQQLERDIASAKLASLKHQINPHFLYNTLSFLYARTLPLSAEVSEAIGKISDMMRYSLEETEENGKVSLEKELAHLKNYIEIHQMRFENSLYIYFEAVGDFSRHQIAPLLLITFVENAFKHGKLNDADYPLQIRLNAESDGISFSVQNIKSTGLKSGSSGIGLGNVKSRLSLLYPGNHDLSIVDDKDAFLIHLSIRTAV